MLTNGVAGWPVICNNQLRGLGFADLNHEILLLIILTFDSKVQIAGTGKFQSGPITNTPVSMRKMVRLSCRLNFWIQHDQLYQIPLIQIFPAIIEATKTRRPLASTI